MVALTRSVNIDVKTNPKFSEMGTGKGIMWTNRTLKIFLKWIMYTKVCKSAVSTTVYKEETFFVLDCYSSSKREITMSWSTVIVIVIR